MNTIKRICQSVALGVLLSSFNPAIADEIQEANKLFKQGQQEQALEKLDSILAAKPKDAQARFLKGLIYTDQGKTAEAIKIFSALTEDYPDLPEPYNNLAVLYAGQGQYEKAKVALEAAIRTHPSYATAHENLGDIYAKMASQAYDRALQLDKSNTSTATKLEMIKDLFGGNNHRTAVTSHVVVSGTTTATPDSATPDSSTAATSSKPVVVGAIDSSKAAPAAASHSANEDVLATVHGWAKAWSSKDSKTYLGFYAKEFKTPDGEERSAWEKQRHDRIAAPKSIQVQITDAKVKLSDDTHATVNFKQHYQASHLNTLSRKTLNLAKSNDKWLIVEERTGN